MAHRFFDFTHLTPVQRVELAVALWDSLPEGSTERPLSEAQRAELVRRLEAYRNEPDAGSSWEDVRELIRRGNKRGR